MFAWIPWHVIEENDLIDKPGQIRNVDESGMPLRLPVDTRKIHLLGNGHYVLYIWGLMICMTFKHMDIRHGRMYSTETF